MKTIEVAAAIIVDEGKILATQRGYGEFEGGWEFPGGKLEPDESPEAATIREIEEELKVKVRVNSHLITVDYSYETFRLIMYCYLCSLESGEIELTEHAAAVWLDASTIDSVDWLPADVEVVEAIKKADVLR